MWDMPGNVEVKLVHAQDALTILSDPEIYDRIRTDKVTKIRLPKKLDYWGGFVDHQLASIGILTPFEKGVKAHFQVLKKFRGEYAFRLGHEHLRKIEHIWSKQDLYVYVTDIFPEVAEFCKALGFREVGVDPQSNLRDGVWHDRVIMLYDPPADG